MGRTEFLTPTIGSEPRLESANHHESEMALFNECTQSCAHILLDTADIVRDGDITTVKLWGYSFTSLIWIVGSEFVYFGISAMIVSAWGPKLAWKSVAESNKRCPMAT